MPLFNGGNPEACKAVYEVTAAALVNMPASTLATNDREKLTRALAQIKDQTSAREQAWTLRQVLDAVRENLEADADQGDDFQSDVYQDHAVSAWSFRW